MSLARAVECVLCPRRCRLAPGERGSCLSRVNLDGQLVSLVYGRPTAVHLDPIEKKPMAHFLPGTSILSLATAGCNLHCRFCQNWQISQRPPEELRSYRLPPASVVAMAVEHGCPSVALTYTEPVVFIEYALDTARACAEAGLLTVLVTAAYASPEPWAELCRHSHGANIDLKAFSEDFYRRYCDGHLRPVLDNIVAARAAGVTVELTNLVIPTLNDEPRELRRMCRWIVREVGADTPLHISRFTPMYRLQELPPTPPETLDMAWEIAREEGLQFVYVGNVAGNRHEDTDCPGCGERLVERRGFRVLSQRVTAGRCPSCARAIYGRWSVSPPEDP